MIVKESFSNLFNKCELFQLSHNKFVVRYAVNKVIYKYPKLVINKALQHPKEKETKLHRLLNFLDDKILYSSFLTQKNEALRWKIRKAELKKLKDSANELARPLSLKYFTDETEVNNEHSPEATETEKVLPLNLPYKSVTHVENTTDEYSETQDTEHGGEAVADNPTYIPRYGRWMSDYECYEEIQGSYEEEISTYASKYGTPDPKIPVSSVPCSGCGALLHCQNPSIPGYLPRELFTPCTEEDLRAIVCQRCHFLKNYNTALSVNVDPVQYPKLIQAIKSKTALIILMVDMTDFPCSIWPGITDLIGDSPVILVGNKIDAIPSDCRGWFNKATKALAAALPKDANIKHVALISAKTGLGVEELITKIQNMWQTKGDIYLLGCTNVGKSTLFNTLLRSDLCKIQAADLMKRATTSIWPGTTLNLLKFPILRPSGWRLFLRTTRLANQRNIARKERELAAYQDRLQKTKTPQTMTPHLIGTLGRTFHRRMKLHTDLFVMEKKPVGTAATSGGGLNERAKVFEKSRWFYDTPGVVHPDQIINELTMEELMKIAQNETILPRMYKFHPGQTLFLGGLARVDFIDGDGYTRIITYTMPIIPITICKLEHAEEVYNTLLGTEVLGIPCGDEQRISAFPKLKAAPRFEFVGYNSLEGCGEIVLSNAGWVTFIAHTGHKCVFEAWTPEARGIYERNPPFLQYMPKMRRQKLSITPQYLLKYRRPE